MSKCTVLQIVNSSLWITVLVVRVGCIIEAYPSPNTKPGQNPIPPNFQVEFADEQQTGELETAASHSFVSSPRNGLGGVSGQISKKQQPTAIFTQLGLTKTSHQQYTSVDGPRDAFISTKIPSETAPPTSSSKAEASHSKDNQSDGLSNSENIKNGDFNYDDELDDSCSGKADGYYQNFGSGCSSYYFCSAGYQATYICPIGLKFNGKRCENDYVCPTTTSDGHHIENVCESKSNGYYPYNSRINAGKYFYCFQKTKVIELQCDPGKIFVRDKCILDSSETITSTSNSEIPKTKSPGSIKHYSAEETSRETDSPTDANTCFRKSNGFYQDVESNCKTYYYCIGGEKTELRCQDEYIFNGDICVHQSRYVCPHIFQKEKSARSNFDSKSKTTTTMTSKYIAVGNDSNIEDNAAEITTESGNLDVQR